MIHWSASSSTVYILIYTYIITHAHPVSQRTLLESPPSGLLLNVVSFPLLLFGPRPFPAVCIKKSLLLHLSVCLRVCVRFQMGSDAVTVVGRWGIENTHTHCVVASWMCLCSFSFSSTCKLLTYYSLRRCKHAVRFLLSLFLPQCLHTCVRHGKISALNLVHNLCLSVCPCLDPNLPAGLFFVLPLLACA